jgi:hypothetical protein
MFSTRHHLPLTSALAGGTVARARGSLLIEWLPGMAHRTASIPAMFPSYRGVTR